MKFDKDFMNSNLEISILGESPTYARSAAENAFSIVEEIENTLSAYKESSEVFAINNAKIGDTIQVSEHCINCLEASSILYTATLGALDVCMGQFFTNSKKQSNFPSPSRICLKIDKENFLVEKTCQGALDFGAIGKGYAVDKIADALINVWGIKSALINFAQSTFFAIGENENTPWQVTLNNSYTLDLKNTYALSASSQNTQEMHILDPLNASCPPSKKECHFALIKNNATYADALSTAFFILSAEEIQEICTNFGAKFYKF